PTKPAVAWPLPQPTSKTLPPDNVGKIVEQFVRIRRANSVVLLRDRVKGIPLIFHERSARRTRERRSKQRTPAAATARKLLLGHGGRRPLHGSAPRSSSGAEQSR